jgi:myo-inositol-1-phosphate synthase
VEGRPPANARTGLWLIGASGNLGAAVTVGAAALSRGLAKPIGLVTSTEPFAGLGLLNPGDLVIGGHEVRARKPGASARGLAAPGGFLPAHIVEAVAAELEAADLEVRPGTLHGASPSVRRLVEPEGNGVPVGETGEEAVRRLEGDIRDFRTRRDLQRVIVVNAASTEPPPESMPRDAEELGAALARAGDSGLRPSSLYALAALRAGCPYVNFTPSVGAELAPITALFESEGLPHAGADGKTGETLVKSALAPLFSVRNLEVLSWTGQNILGNRDGMVLSDPSNRESKIRSKSTLLGGILGYDPEQRVGIDYVESLGDWKVAWDFIHFRGFLGEPMRMQFTWEGCDSLLAAPLILDLSALVALAHARGESGVLGHLAVFFKAPIGGQEHSLVPQFERLLGHVTRG